MNPHACDLITPQQAIHTSKAAETQLYNPDHLWPRSMKNYQEIDCLVKFEVGCLNDGTVDVLVEDRIQGWLNQTDAGDYVTTVYRQAITTMSTMMSFTFMNMIVTMMYDYGQWGPVV